MIYTPKIYCGFVQADRPNIMSIIGLDKTIISSVFVKESFLSLKIYSVRIYLILIR